MSDFFRINLLVPSAENWDPSLGFARDFPEGMGMKTYKICQGLEVQKGEYPKDAKIYLAEGRGSVLSDLIGNSCNILIVSKRVKEAFEHVNNAPTQYLPVSIFDFKKKLLSNDYFIINPIGTYDILDLKKSKIMYLKKDIVSIETYVADPAKTEHAPDLFRIKEKPDEYVVSQKMREYLKAQLKPKPTNIWLIKMG